MHMSAGLPSSASPAAALADIVGADHVATDVETLTRYARDRLPFGIFKARSGGLPGVMPVAVAKPANESELVELLARSKRDGFRVIPFGLGSGVLGATIPLGGEVMLDLTRLNRLVEIDETNGLAVVQAGMNGGEFERALNAAGWTCGHLPQSINISTVGGWAACRGGGQASSRYGKIEDIVIGLKAVLPDGRRVDVRPVARRAVGHVAHRLFVAARARSAHHELTAPHLPQARGRDRRRAGASETRTRLWRRAPHHAGRLRPQVVRIYDET
jgi:alkyldihydroxyacetonephosphate synthase